MRNRLHPLRELLLARFRESFREPEVVFWTYGFPLLLAVGLGIAFRNRPMEQIYVDVEQHTSAAAVAEHLRGSPGFTVEVHLRQACRERLRLGKSSITVVPGEHYTFVYDPTRPESALARQRVDDVLQRAAGRRDPIPIREQQVQEPGARYIDFLVPGLIGMNLMGSGMWGVGFVIVDMRVRKLLKRFVATPMKRSDFLWSMVGGRMLFMFPELGIILGAGVLLFGVAVRGSIAGIFLISVTGALCFAGLGLLVACRAQHIETVSGLMNLVMLPMWLLSGVFFSSDRFPAYLQPLVQALPLTQLNNALRAVILEGAPLPAQAGKLAILVAWGGISFAIALRCFRWN
ncbi:MAG: ABC transporter permease [Acidobacteria bacterium]|nr:ABC transporter permease [Acidobacteriota bacterium]